MKTLVLMVLATLVAVAVTESPGQAVQVLPSVKPERADANGKVWTHSDPVYLASYVAWVNRYGSAGSPVAPPTGTVAKTADVYGFVKWLNSYRAQNGMAPVGYDLDLSNWAAINNGQQQSKGLGHHFMGRARRQNSGMGAGSTVWNLWTLSPAHNSALLDPTIRAIGIASDGLYWKFNAY